MPGGHSDPDVNSTTSTFSSKVDVRVPGCFQNPSLSTADCIRGLALPVKEDPAGKQATGKAGQGNADGGKDCQGEGGEALRVPPGV